MTSARLLSTCATLAALASIAPCQRILGETFGDQVFSGYGVAIAPIADIDGDGVPDLVIGEPGRDLSAGAGIVDSGAAVLRSSRTGLLRSRNSGLQTGGRFGSSVAGLGDVNGDGVPDWAAGSPVAGAMNHGYARIMSGADGVMFWEVLGEQRSELGAAIAAVPDVDGDGRADIAISSPMNSNVRPYGTVRCYRGNTGAYAHQYAGLSMDETGRSLASIPDVSGDGMPDLIVGEPNFAFGGTGSGHVYLIDPRRPAASGIVWEAFVPFQGGWHVGSVVAAAGDVNGDGVQDVLCGTAVGRVMVLSGTNGSELRTHVSSEAGYGRSMAGVGDFDGDGRDDYAIGAPWSSTGGRVYVHSGDGGGLIATLNGGPASAFGSSIARLGDLDGDGRADFAVGAPMHLHNGSPLGRVSIHGFTIAPVGDPFGAGCAGAAGIPHLYVAGEPRVGAAFDTRCANAPANVVGLWLTGWSDTTAQGMSLPLDLTPFGIPGCQMLVSPDDTQWFLQPVGYAVRTIAVPNVPSLAGVRFFSQAALLDATRVGGLSFSNGVRIRIGSP